jgi:lipoate-protein ligase B
MQAYIAKYGLKSYPSEHTGLFLTPDVKLGSIGVQVRHRLTSHGIALNITNEPIPWFDQVVACGLDEVRAGSVSQATRLDLQIEPEARGLIAEFGVGFKRDVQSLDKGDPELLDLVTRLHEEALKAGTWPNAPRGHI